LLLSNRPELSPRFNIKDKEPDAYLIAMAALQRRLPATVQRLLDRKTGWPDEADEAEAGTTAETIT
jgi:hypothetical protein